MPRCHSGGSETLWLEAARVESRVVPAPYGAVEMTRRRETRQEARRARTPPREGPFQTEPVARSRVLIDEEAPPPLPSARPPLHVFSILPFHTSARTPCHGRHQFHRER